MCISHKFGSIVNWQQNVDNIQADSCNGSQPEILESKELQKVEKRNYKTAWGHLGMLYTVKVLKKSLSYKKLMTCK